MDRKGVMGLPFRLAIAFMIIALFAPSVISAAESFSKDTDMADMRNEAEKAEDLAKNLWFAGKGSEGSVSIKTAPGYSIRFGGDGADAWSYSIMDGDDIVEKHRMETPDVRFLGEGFTATGSCNLRMLCTLDADGNYGISVAYA